ncbi:MAG: PQQ-binding-like beta-propeller repeat protein [Candidatus Firestonebacteria bacterium]
MKRFIVSVLALLAVAGFAFSAENWPNFNGPKLDNISSDKGLLKSWPAEGPKLLWKFDKCGKGYSGVSVADGTIYVAGDFEDDCKVIALDLSGKVKWEAIAGAAWSGNYPGTRCTPTYSDGLVYYMNANGEINAFDSKTGEVSWTLNIAVKLKGRKGGWGYAESLIVDGNNLLVLAGGKDILMAALDKKTGKQVWATPNPINEVASYCSPNIVEYKGMKLILTMTQKSVICVNAKTGELLWNAPHKTSYDVNATTPVLFEGLVYVTSGYGVGNDCFEIETGNKSVKKAWSTKSMDNHHGGVVSLNGFVYGSGERSWFCIDLKTGKDMWENKGVGKGSVTYADGLLYTLSERGKVGIVEAVTDKFNLLSSFQLPKESTDPFWAHPVVIGCRLYIRHDQNLYVLDVKAK